MAQGNGNDRDHDERDRRFPPRIWRDRDPGDEDPGSRNVELFHVSPGERIDCSPPADRSRR